MEKSPANGATRNKFGLSTLQQLQHLGVGFVSLTEGLDLTTPAGRAMAGLPAVFAEFERDILRERVCAASHDGANQNGRFSKRRREKRPPRKWMLL